MAMLLGVLPSRNASAPSHTTVCSTWTKPVAPQPRLPQWSSSFEVSGGMTELRRTRPNRQ
eukprot:scaffold13628_cov31-Tisochrysis_lutea.AAC.3